MTRVGGEACKEGGHIGPPLQPYKVESDKLRPVPNHKNNEELGALGVLAFTSHISRPYALLVTI